MYVCVCVCVCRCSKSLLEHLFAGGYRGPLSVGDRARVTPFLNKDLKAFLAEPMASAVAAQFLVSRQAVLTRPLLFWQELQALTNGTKLIRRYVCSSVIMRSWLCS